MVTYEKTKVTETTVVFIARDSVDILKGYWLPRHQGDSPPRNDLATNVLATKRSLLAANHQ